MRRGLPALLLALAPGLVATSTIAEDVPTSVIAIDDAIFTKHSELSSAKKDRDNQQQTLNEHEEKLSGYNKAAKKLDRSLSKSKSNLERDYSRMIDEPDLDLSSSQTQYQEAWAGVKQNQVLRLEAEQELEEQQATLAKKQAEVTRIEENIASLEDSKLRARAERLKHELRQSGSQKVSFTNVCSTSMTIAQCDKQTVDLALQKSVNQFQAALIDETTEENLIKQNLDKVSLNIHVLRHQIVESGFYDGKRYRAIMDVQLDARPTEVTACTLLDLDSQYCFAPGQYNESQVKQKETAWVTLIIRSNQHNDRVAVNGVSYGSTPVEIMLPVGAHMVSVAKEGYRSFNQELKIDSDHQLRAVLRENRNELKAGQIFADALSDNSSAPNLVTFTPGTYHIGEHASKQVHLDHAFAIGATPTTVQQFEHFVKSTNYQTDAELTKVCTTIKRSEITPVPDSYWRNPGFKQYVNSPVVCVSQNDAFAYTRWLSEQTGYNYRLPTEDEWEIAARAGTETKYWWGDKFKPGEANTGWSGTPWSNTSTSPVSAFEPNSMGLYDMIGNVWEWTNDRRGMSKGGAWSFSPAMASAHERLFVAPSSASNYVGFRIIREIN
ncbi:SUMF1/EgtB/PvdO family nonheme iron enzyme [Vibrio sp. ZSDE26]|uniref:SUMF1/EgtB/PvdO family nonheme iron enzyme n=1 Tax=Vibrio amylolyticus TaxID=2847292 RepID=A0A9X1XRM8_9VIBR|nr:formylglycine-generating enzyme family protein [Vibrio amylolyticus]MCK6264339.1 SUMF1/EgtB/PvdO family nonheme iron enzyme [Vibrio amylolyticus]